MWQPFNPYFISETSRRINLNPVKTLKHILISRAFTSYQLTKLVVDKLPKILNNNPGEYTIPAETLQTLIGDTEADKLVVGVSQFDMNEIQHDDKTINTAMRNGNSVMLDIVQ